MRVACYADDPREPTLIGECDVNLKEVLTKGETDGKYAIFCHYHILIPGTEWFTLTNKDKFSGKVYLEMTFWSNVRLEITNLDVF